MVLPSKPRNQLWYIREISASSIQQKNPAKILILYLAVLPLLTSLFWNISMIFPLMQAPGVGDGQGSLACCNSWGRKESHMTECLN